MKLPLLETVGGAAIQCSPSVEHRPSTGETHACQGYTPKGYDVAKPMVKPSLVNTGATWEPENRKQTP